MPPDDTDGLDDDDLPGLHDDQLDADSPSTESAAPDAADHVDPDAPGGDTSLDDIPPINFVDPIIQMPTGEFDDEGGPGGDGQDFEGDGYDVGVDGDVYKPIKPSPPKWIYVGGFLGLVLVGSIFVFRGDADDAGVALPSEVPAEETAAPSAAPVVADTEAAADAVEDEPADELVVAFEVRTIDVEGEPVDVTLWRAPTATHVLVAAPSLNSNVDDLAGLAATLAGQDCANVAAFDSSQAPGARMYSHFIENFDDFGFDSDAGFSTLGSSVTAADALIAAVEFGGQDVFLFSPSDPPPFSWEEISPRIDITYPLGHVVVRITTGDLQYRPMFDLWIAASFEGYVVDGENHGTAFFNEAAAEPVLKEVLDHTCFFVHD